MGAAAGAAGLIVLVAGTFLPWLSSGRARRNSYRASGALERLLDPHGAEHIMLQAWPFLTLACVAVVALFALGARRVACLLTVVPGVSGAVVALGALNAHGNAFAKVDGVGPSVTLVGAAVALAAATVFLISARAPRDRDGATT